MKNITFLSSALLLSVFLVAPQAHAAPKGGSPYVGITAGYGTAKDKLTILGKHSTKESTIKGRTKGTPVGVFAGYGYHFQNDFYLAGEADYIRNLGRTYKSTAGGSSFGVSVLPGYFVRPNTLLFSRIGYRHGEDGENGLAFGGGVSQYLTDNLELRLEYVSTRFGTHHREKDKISDVSYRMKESDQNVRLGVSYHF